jgi:ankyrin repeat protein
MTSLTASCYSGYANIVKTLLQCVTPHTVNIQCGEYNDSALHFVIWHGRDSRVNALHTACGDNDIETVNTLLYIDDVNVQAGNGDTPLHRASRYGNVDIVQSLLSVFADINITDDYRRTPVEHVKYYGNNELVPCFSQLLPRCANTATNVTTSVSVTQSTSSVASITDVTIGDVTIGDVTISDVTSGYVTISDVHSRQQHDRKRVSVHNTVKQRPNTYV